MSKRILCLLTAAILLLLPWASPAEDDECLHKHWELRNVKKADVGVPGYTGDKYCLDCHTVFQRGKETPALESPAGSALDGSQDQSGDSSESGSGQSGKPSEPTKKPATKPTAKPTKKPATKPTAKPTVKPKKQEKLPTAPSAKSTPAPKKQNKPAAKKKQQSGKKGTVGTRRIRFSKKYPFRRVRMNPIPGIRAEAAGILVWPRPASPLQQILNE